MRAGRRPDEAGRRRRWLFRGLLFTGAAVLLEGVLRLGMGNFAQSRLLRRSEDPAICLENRPSQDLVYTGWLGRVRATRMRTNGVGARGGEFVADGRPRLAVLGDSFTFGQGVEEEQAFASIVAGVVGAQAMNFGVPGHGTPQSVALLEKRVVPLRPDIVLLCVFANDLSAEDSYCTRGQGGTRASRFLLQNWYAGRAAWLLAAPLRQIPSASVEQSAGSPAERFVGAVRRAHQLADEGGFVLAVVLLTDRAMFLESRYCRGCAAPHDLLAGSPVRVIDMSEVWLSLQRDIAANFIPGDDHLSVAGNLRMGEAIGAALLDWDVARMALRRP
jgi:hypothetical protein